jgi:hypothetical protein
MRTLVSLFLVVLLSGCMIVVHEPTPNEEPHKVCIDPTAKFYIDCVTGKLIADDAYVR